jgi:hypothetical protein
MIEKNDDDDINRNKKQQEIEAKEKEIEETLENVSDKTVKESKKEAKILGDSEHE